MRTPTAEELDGLAVALSAEGYGIYHDEAAEVLTSAHVGVIDGYISDGPGYAGRVAVVVFSGGPELHAVYTVDPDGAWAEVRKDGAP